MAAYEVLLLNTAVPQIQAAQSGDTYVVPRAIAFNAGVNVVNNDVTIYGVTVGRGAGAVATNTAVGASALAANTTGSYNTALGIQAGQVNTTGIQSTFIGGLAGYNNTTGSITAVGYAALAFNTTGTSNVAVGNNDGVGAGGALQANTTGSYNSALGSGTLSANTTGANNTASGYQALALNTTASSNTAVGYQSLYSNNLTVSAGAFVTGTSYVISFVGTTNFTLIGAANNNLGTVFTATGAGTGTGTAIANGGANNTAVGYQAGYSNTTGANNVFVGMYAGYDHTTGDRNLLIGPRNNAGVGAGNFLYTGSDNVYVGGYDGYFGGALDLRYQSGYLALSDGYGRPLIITKTGQTVALENGVANATGTGITFPATQNASSNANTLDDYEEGIWTPAVRGSITAGTYELAAADGSYVKIGKQVTLTCRIAFAGSLTGGGTGYLQIIGAPSFNNAASAYGAVSQSGLDMTTNYTWLTASFISVSGTTTLYLDENGDSTSSGDFPISGVSANDSIRFSITYIATA